MLWKKSFCCIFLFFLTNAAANAYTVYNCWTSREGWGVSVSNFTTNSEAVYFNVRDSSYTGFMTKKWYRPNGIREDDIGTNLLAHPVNEGGSYAGHWSYMVIKDKNREPGQWRVEHWVKDVSLVWHLLCTNYFSITKAVAKPIFSPPPRTYTIPQRVTLSCSTSSATIHYTTDGSNPTKGSIIYSTPIDVSKTVTIKAKAYKDGLTPSETVTGKYTISKFIPSIPLLLLDN